MTDRLARWLGIASLLLGLASPCAAQPGSARCRSLPEPTLATLPDEAPSLHAPADATVARAATIEAMPIVDPARPGAMLELAEAYRSLGRSGDEIRTLARIAQDHPTWESGDRVQFRLGRALAASQQPERARQVGLHLVQQFPASDYVQPTYLAFGDYFFEQGDYASAQQFFERALLTPHGRWTAYAQYRLAWTLARSGERAALQRLADANATLSAPGAPQIGAAPLRAALNTDQGGIGATLACHP
jgi:tetratricopeptide (TPR) repeat protein